MSLIQTLPDGPLDIVGDVHGESAALDALLTQLGYREDGSHPQQRKLVFVGDLVDRGRDSPGVLARARRLIEAGHAYCVLGNHEINLLVDDIKDGSGWFFDERLEQDAVNYAPFERTPEALRPEVRRFLNGLPIALVREDIRIVHAAWTADAIAAVAAVPLGDITRQYHAWTRAAQAAAEAKGVYQRYLEDRQRWFSQLEDEVHPPPFLESFAEYEAMQQMFNPLKVLTSGVEARASETYFAGQRWRYSDRVNWWDSYKDPTPVVIGHYWRSLQPPLTGTLPRYTLMFKNIDPLSWFGGRGNVFCVDYSVGARWRDRKVSRPVAQSRFKLAALRWPEKTLVLDSGETLPTAFGA
jgi:hypothetical protein